MLRPAIVFALAIPAVGFAGPVAAPLHPAEATEIVAKPPAPEVEVIIARQRVAERAQVADDQPDRLEPIVASLDHAPF